MAAGMKRARVAEEDDCKLFIDKYRKARGVLTQANLAEGVELIEKMLGRKYHNKAWGLAALDFTQYVMSGDDKLDSPAQRLALFGDKVMDFELCLIWDNRGFSRDSWQKEKDRTLANKRFSTILHTRSSLIPYVQFPETADVRLNNLSDHDKGTLAESLVGSAWKDEFEKTESHDCAMKAMRGAMAKLNIAPRNDRELFVRHYGNTSTATENRAAKRDPIVAQNFFCNPKAATAAAITTKVHAKPEEPLSIPLKRQPEVLRAGTAPRVSPGKSTTRTTAPGTILSTSASIASLSSAIASANFVSGTVKPQANRTPLSTIMTNAKNVFVFTAGATSQAKTSTRNDKIRADLEAKGYVDTMERSTANDKSNTSAKILTGPSSVTPEIVPLTKSSSEVYSDAPIQTPAPAKSSTADGSVGTEGTEIDTVHDEAENTRTSTDTFKEQQSKEQDRCTLDDNKENERRPSVAVEGV